MINLGTNDGSAATDPKFHYTKTYTEVVMAASKHCESAHSVGRLLLLGTSVTREMSVATADGPALNVFLACGPMSTTCVLGALLSSDLL